ncbi:MAG: nickel/cobalt transporter [Paracoccaceae bacterium]
MRLSPVFPVILLAALILVLWYAVPWSALMAWAVEAQRGFQEAMARALRAVQAGDPAAVMALCTATAAYGFVHALGPGHGKVLLGGAALASGATLRRMTVLTVLSSIAQALAAIALVGGLGVILGIGSRQLGDVADQWLAPLSAVAIGAIGVYLIYRGWRLWRRAPATCCGHAHGPSVEDSASLASPREAAALIASIAVRPCTGALFVLVIALRFDVFWVGCLAVLTMGLGTAALNLLVAWSGVAARRLSVWNSQAKGDVRLLSAGLHVLGGGLVASLSLVWLMTFWA